jgi:hypothetical protein
VRRHPLVACGILAASGAATAAALVVAPRSYLVETRIMTHQTIVMPALNNPRRSVPSESDAPGRMASEAVLSHDNLVNVIHQTGLLEKWPAIRSPLGKMRASVMERLFGVRQTDAERTSALVSMLQNRLWVVPSDGKDGQDGTLTIGILWPDARTGLQIVQTAQQNFIEKRHANEIALIMESISILNEHLALARQTIDEALGSMRQMVAARSAAQSDDPLGALHLPATAPNRPNALEIASVQAALAAKRTTIADLEQSRTQRLAALQTQMTELQSTYGPAHPEVVSLRESINALSKGSPQVAALRADEASLKARLSALGGSDIGEPIAAPAEPLLTRAVLERIARGRPDTLEDPNVTYAKSRLKIAIGNYEDLLGRVESARIELETARAAFKYRYTVIRPPELPTRPVSPRPARIVAGGIALGMLLAVFAATALDVIGGRLLERWQVERQLGLPLIGSGRLL